ncbi:hypothetical protein [Hydrogenimonas urashimensis]|uniref:hypothetical protein n=1 Tax=Hydrogenimonas urashimensis TaxID=2740515 RepID=UPI001915080A|nr:hypothetical protein [Hydrogenimonas urashimensis]
MGEEKSNHNPWLHELRHLYGAGILLFYYAKWPILVGWPLLRLYLDYPDNWIIDALWIWCLILVIKDFYVWFIKKESYCTAKSCKNEKEEKNGDSSEHESQ